MIGRRRGRTAVDSQDRRKRGVGEEGSTRMAERGMRTGGSLSANAAGTRMVNPKRRERYCVDGGEEGAMDERGRREEREGCVDGGVSLGVGTTVG